MAAPSVTLSGTLQDPSGTATPGVVRITLLNSGEFPPFVPDEAAPIALDPLSVQIQAAANGTWSTSLWANSQISPAGTLYQVQLFPAIGGLASSSPIWSEFYIFAPGTYDLSTQVPVSG